MHILTTWAAFLGSWLLFTGPLLQAALELTDQHRSIGEQRLKELHAAVSGVQSEPGPSPWWWLLPPAGYVKSIRHANRQRTALFERLSRQAGIQLVQYKTSALGWAIVATGAFLIAIRETSDVVELYEGSWWVSILMIIVMATSGAAFTAVSARRRHDLLALTYSYSRPTADHTD